MTTAIKIRKENKKLLKHYHEGTFDKIVAQLIDDVAENIQIVGVDYSPISSIKLSDETISKLESFKLTDGESYENIILRMLLVAQSLNTGDE